MNEVKIGDRRSQLRLESYKGWAKVGRRVAIVILGRFKKLAFFI